MKRDIDYMFSRIADKYDTMNQVLSFGIHNSWKKKFVSLSCAKPGDSILDCASGTGDLALLFKNVVGSNGKVIASDINEDMLNLAREKFKLKQVDIQCEQADAQNMRFENQTFEVTSIGFGIRNVDSPLVCLKEMSRVTKSGGKVMVLEFGQPKGLFRIVYNLYNKLIFPIFAKIIAKDISAYKYLTQTASQFPCRENFLDIMRQSDVFSETRFIPLSFGIAYIYIGIVR